MGHLPWQAIIIIEEVVYCYATTIMKVCKVTKPNKWEGPTHTTIFENHHPTAQPTIWKMAILVAGGIYHCS